MRNAGSSRIRAHRELGTTATTPATAIRTSTATPTHAHGDVADVAGSSQN